MTREEAIKRLETIIANSTAAYDYSISTNEWKNYGKERLYLAVYETCENSKHNVKYDFGYIDLLTANYVAGKKDLTQNFDLSGAKF